MSNQSSISVLTMAVGLLICASATAGDYGAQFDGFIKPLHDADVAFLETGVLQEIHVAVGDRVQAGQLLAVLDDQLQQSHVRIAKSQAEKEGEWRAAKAEESLHRERCRKLRLLYADNMAQLEELNRAEADAEIAAGRYLAAEEERRLRQQELARAKIQLERRSLKAPFDGVVSELVRQVGEYVPPTDPVVLRLIADDSMIAVVNVPAEFLPKCQVGSAVRIRTTAPPLTFQATVRSVCPAIDGESGTVRVQAVFENPGRKCRPGDRCTVTFLPDPFKAAEASQQESRVPR